MTRPAGLWARPRAESCRWRLSAAACARKVGSSRSRSRGDGALGMVRPRHVEALELLP